jgi:polyisoprenoid-binding protein YceI
MRQSNLFSKFLMVLLFGGMFNLVYGQAKFSAKNTVQLSIAGTSTMHDWVMKTSTGDCNATLQVDGDGHLKDITAMSFSVGSKSLKSGKDGMDKNAYKALKADKNPTISATLKSADVTMKDAKSYTIKATINLTIAGKTVETTLDAQAKKMNDTSFSVKGEKKISMKEYDMQPPSFMLGAVKTGNDVVLSFDLVLNQ